MSTNLYCDEVWLCQTPTHIAYLCYFADAKKRTASDWKTILWKYLAWYRYEVMEHNATHYSYKSNLAQFREHEAEFKAAIKKYKKLTFYIVSGCEP